MRILLTSPTYPPINSGLGNAVAQQAAALLQAGHEVVVATGGAKRCSMEVEGVRVEAFNLRGADSWLHPIKGSVSQYIDFLIHNAWDVVLLNAWQNWATDLAMRNLDKITGRKFVYSHCISTNVFYSHQPIRSLLRYVAWRPYWWRLPELIKRLDGVLFLAESGTDTRFDDLRIARQYAVSLHIVPNSLSPAAVAILNKPIVPSSDRERLIAIGSFHWQKGFDFLLRAYAASQAKHKYALHLYGQENSAYSANLRYLSLQLGLGEDQVFFHTGVTGEKLLEAYCQAKLVLSGSHTECQPLALIDANAAGTPFVARSTGCIANMQGGVVVNTWEKMAQEVDALVEDVPTWNCLSEAGRQVAKNIYHPAVTAKQLLCALTSKTPRMPAGSINEG